MDAARTRKSPAVVAAVKAIRKSLAENPDPLAKWNLSLQGGDPAAGQAIFNSHPAAECRAATASATSTTIGGVTAPDLAGVANRHSDRRYFLESLVTPSAVVAPGFGVVAVDFKNGTSLNGNLIADTPEHLDLEVEGKPIRIRRDDIAEVTPPVSAMPSMGELAEPHRSPRPHRMARHPDPGRKQRPQPRSPPNLSIPTPSSPRKNPPPPSIPRS